MVQNDAKRLLNKDYRMMREIAHDQHKQQQEEKKEKQAEATAKLQIAWEREKFLHEKQERTQSQRVEHMNRWLAEGKSVADVGILLEMSGLAAQPNQPKEASG
ncbi:hypothetical protein DFH28DRAFT_1080305 [Melampsora americana]|nr:hypothetical protein DFH28DRAFT_1080305 [Melampsora americana]